MKSITQLRKKIDLLDKKIIGLLSQRQQLAKSIGKIKITNQLPIADAGREKSITQHLHHIAKKHHLSPKLIDQLWHVIFKHSRSLQKRHLKIKLNSNSQPISIGLIGFGRFGQLLHQILTSHFTGLKITVFDSDPKQPPNQKVNFSSLKQVAASDVVILAVPISAFESVIKQISSLLKPKALVVDVCTVKVLPIKIMKQHLPKNIHILATHPLWGPDSAAHDLERLKTVLIKVRLPDKLFIKIKKLTNSLGMEVIEMTADEHDKLLAKSQNLTHLIGRILEALKVTSTPIDTQTFKQLLSIMYLIVNDTSELFHDMQTFNPYAKAMSQDFLKAFNQINHQLEKK